MNSDNMPSLKEAQGGPGASPVNVQEMEIVPREADFHQVTAKVPLIRTLSTFNPINRAVEKKVFVAEAPLRAGFFPPWEFIELNIVTEMARRQFMPEGIGVEDKFIGLMDDTGTARYLGNFGWSTLERTEDVVGVQLGRMKSIVETGPIATSNPQKGKEILGLIFVDGEIGAEIARENEAITDEAYNYRVKLYQAFYDSLRKHHVPVQELIRYTNGNRSTLVPRITNARGDAPSKSQLMARLSPRQQIGWEFLQSAFANLNDPKVRSVMTDLKHKHLRHLA